MNLGQFFDNLQEVYADIIYKEGYQLTAKALRDITRRAAAQVASLELRAQDAENEAQNLNNELIRHKRAVRRWRDRAINYRPYSAPKRNAYKRRVETLQKRCDELVRTADSLSARLEDAHEQRAVLRQETKQRGEVIEAQRLELVETKNALAMANRNYHTARSESHAHYRRLDECSQERATFERQLKAVNAELAEARELLRQQCDERRAVNAENRELQTKLSDASVSTLMDTLKERDKLRKRINVLCGELNRLALRYRYRG